MLARPFEYVSWEIDPSFVGGIGRVQGQFARRLPPMLDCRFVDRGPDIGNRRIPFQGQADGIDALEVHALVIFLLTALVSFLVVPPVLRTLPAEVGRAALKDVFRCGEPDDGRPRGRGTEIAVHRDARAIFRMASAFILAADGLGAVAVRLHHARAVGCEAIALLGTARTLLAVLVMDGDASFAVDGDAFALDAAFVRAAAYLVRLRSRLGR